MILTVHTKQETSELGDLYGLFFEDINHAADGGLYAELIQNRSFEFDPIDNPAYHSLTAWEAVGGAALAVREGGAVSEKNLSGTDGAGGGHGGAESGLQQRHPPAKRGGLPLCLLC